MEVSDPPLALAASMVAWMFVLSYVGELAQARTAPVRGSSTTMAPVRPASACSAATWMRESMVSWTELPGSVMPASELRAFCQLE